MENNNELRELKEQLTSELNEWRKSKKTTLLITCILLPVMVAYMSWMYTSVKSLLEPEGIATMISARIQYQIPKLANQISSGLKADAGKNVHKLSEMVLDSLPLLRKRAEGFIDESADKIADAAEEELGEVFSNLLAPGSREVYSGILLSLADEEMAKQFCSDLFDGFAEELDRGLQEEIHLSLDDILDTTLRTFQAVLTKLDTLSEDKLSESEALQREFVMILMEFLRKTHLPKRH